MIKIFKPHNIDGHSPYAVKQYNRYIYGLNGGVYTNTSLSLVQFDLWEIYLIESTQSYFNIANHSQMLGEMSVDYIATVGHSLGFGETVSIIIALLFGMLMLLRTMEMDLLIIAYLQNLVLKLLHPVR